MSKPVSAAGEAMLTAHLPEILPIIEHLNETVLSDLPGSPFSLSDFQALENTNSRLKSATSLFWVSALHFALKETEKLDWLVSTWNLFGELICIGYNDTGPIYVLKASASLEEISSAIRYLTNTGSVQ